MLRSLFSGISGLRAHQTMMDVVGNNISNVNTVGYKDSSTVFEDTLSQMVQNGTAPTATTGGMNAAQVGLGVRLGGVSTNFGQGSTQLTGKSTDMMIQGDGFFVVNNGSQNLYTRAGAFTLDANGSLTTPDGAIVQGWNAVNGTINTQQTPAGITLPVGLQIPPTPTSAVGLGGNVPATAAVGTAFTTTINTYDAQGTVVPESFTFTKTGTDTWSMAATNATPAASTVTFDPASGKLTSASPVALTIGTQAVSVDLTKLTQFGQSNTLSALTQNGSATGSLQSFSVQPDGVVMGVFTNGVKQPIAQVAVATFNNPGGLEKAGNSDFVAGPNSGVPQIGVAGTGGRGSLVGGALEMSNVDLATEFTNLIVAQRGFQANSKIITASDEILQDLVNLKR
jgi:flagellar hook protein FlgE